MLRVLYHNAVGAFLKNAGALVPLLLLGRGPLEGTLFEIGGLCSLAMGYLIWYDIGM